MLPQRQQRRRWLLACSLLLLKSHGRPLRSAHTLASAHALARLPACAALTPLTRCQQPRHLPPVLPQPATWYDEAGYCWCDMPDGWRYWWDATSGQWQQHCQTPEGAAAAPAAPQAEPPQAEAAPEVPPEEQAAAEVPAAARKAAEPQPQPWQSTAPETQPWEPAKPEQQAQAWQPSSAEHHTQPSEPQQQAHAWQPAAPEQPARDEAADSFGLPPAGGQEQAAPQAGASSDWADRFGLAPEGAALPAQSAAQQPWQPQPMQLPHQQAEASHSPEQAAPFAPPAAASWQPQQPQWQPSRTPSPDAPGTQPKLWQPSPSPAQVPVAQQSWQSSPSPDTAQWGQQPVQPAQPWQPSLTPEVQQQWGQAATPEVPEATAQPSFMQPGAAPAPYGQAGGAAYPGALAQPAAATYGGTGGAGAYTPHGRPGAAFAKLLFGGRVLVANPSGMHCPAAAPAPSACCLLPASVAASTRPRSSLPCPPLPHAGHIQLLAMQCCPAEVLQPLPGAPTASLSATLRVLEAFPGPLSSNTKAGQVCARAVWQRGIWPATVSARAAIAAWALAMAQAWLPGLHPTRTRPQVAKFCEEQVEAAATDPTAEYSAAEGQRTLWAVLRVLAQHQGRTSSAPYSMLPAPGGGAGSAKQPDAAALPEAQLAAALLDGLRPAADAQLLLPSAAPVPQAAAAAAAEVQQLLLEGRRTDALG